jgi:uncharacterized protein (TIGR02996 family)
MPDGLSALLDLWRETRAVEVARAVDALTPAPAKNALYPMSASVDSKQRRWLMNAHPEQADLLPALLATLHDAGSLAVQERVHALASWPDDPRIASAFVRLYEQPAHLNISTLPLWESLAAALVRLADPGTLSRLDAVAALGDAWVGMFKPHMRPLIGVHLQRLRDALADRIAHAAWRPLTAAERAAVKTGPGPAADTLLAAVLAEPDDVSRRFAYADLLLASGDPRGELIALQCSGATTAAQARRVKQLLAKHRAEWLGPLAPVVDAKSARFERGFPSEVTLKFSAQRQLSPVLGHAAWSTVHTIVVDHERALVAPLQLFVHPAMKHLRTVRGLYSDELRNLGRGVHVLPIERIGFSFDDKPITLKTLDASKAFEKLKAVEVRGGLTRGLLEAWARQTRFEVTLKRR